LYLLSCIKPLDAFTSGAERLQSELVQTFPSSKRYKLAFADYIVDLVLIEPTREKEKKAK